MRWTEGSLGKTVFLHENTYRREIIHIDQSTEEKSLNGIIVLNKNSEIVFSANHQG